MFGWSTHTLNGSQASGREHIWFRRSGPVILADNHLIRSAEMKSPLKKLVSAAVRNDSLWALLDSTLLRATHYAEYQRGKKSSVPIVSEKMILPEDEREAIERIFPDHRVRHGVFSGMRYPEIEAVGSAMFPKLLGSYESELRAVMDRVCKTDYTEIVNIGCGEGYYAVGLAMRIPKARVYAYDINEEAIRLCRKMAAANGVSERLVTGSFCDAETLKSIPFTQRALIISDCEGYEKELFTEDVALSLARHDILIELHDFIDLTISSVIRERFAGTHQVESIFSTDDIRKAHTYSYPELDGFDITTVHGLLKEGRPGVMEWFYMTPWST